MVLGITEVTFPMECIFQAMWQSSFFEALIESFRKMPFINWGKVFENLVADTTISGTVLFLIFLRIRAASSGFKPDKNTLLEMSCCGFGTCLESLGRMVVKNSLNLLTLAFFFARLTTSFLIFQFS